QDLRPEANETARPAAGRTASPRQSGGVLPHARPHLTLPCVKSAPARAASCMRIRSAARSNSCLHFSEQKKYRRFLYSRLGTPLPIPGPGSVLAGCRPDDAGRLPASHARDHGVRAGQLGWTRPRRDLLRGAVVLRTERGLRPQQEPGAEQQRAGGLAGEEETSHAGWTVQPGRQYRPKRAPGRPAAWVFSLASGRREVAVEVMVEV